MTSISMAHVEEHSQKVEVHLRKSQTSGYYYWTRSGLVLLLSKPYAQSPKIALDNLSKDYPAATIVSDTVGINPSDS